MSQRTEKVVIPVCTCPAHEQPHVHAELFVDPWGDPHLYSGGTRKDPPKKKAQ